MRIHINVSERDPLDPQAQASRDGLNLREQFYRVGDEYAAQEATAAFGSFKRLDSMRRNNYDGVTEDEFVSALCGVVQHGDSVIRSSLRYT